MRHAAIKLWQGRHHVYRTVRLSKREGQCLTLLATGLRRGQIAQTLGVTVVTVDLHLSNAKRKLDARTREQALVRAVLWKLIAVDEEPAL